MAKWNYTKGLHKLADGVYAYLDPPGLWGESNTGLIVDGDQSLVVDTKYDLVVTREMLKAMEAVPGAFPVNYLVTTHVDGDHHHGNELLKGTPIIASKACAEEFSKDLTPQGYAQILKNAPNMGKLGRYFTQNFGKYHYEGITMTPPNVTFEGRLDIKVGRTEVNLIEVGPAHTGGDIIVYLPAEKVLFAGDVVMTAFAQVSWAGPYANIIKAIDRILGLDIDILVAGHGPIGDKSGAQRAKDYWEYTAGEARKYYDQGLEVMEAATKLSTEGRYTEQPLPVFNIINMHMLYREFSGQEEPLKKFEVIGRIADMMIPD